MVFLSSMTSSRKLSNLRRGVVGTSDVELVGEEHR